MEESMSVNTIKGMDVDVAWGAVDKPAVDWRKQPDADLDADDETLPFTSPDVVAMLGFDPLELEGSVKANQFHSLS
jgi:hypothetical protein